MVTHFSLALVFALLSPHLAAQEHDGELFEKSIRPILVERCVACHNPAVLEGGLDLTSAAGFAKGATTGPLLPIEAPERSRLLAAISYEERVKMPPDGRLDPRGPRCVARLGRDGSAVARSRPGGRFGAFRRQAGFHRGTKELLGVSADKRSGSAVLCGIVGQCHRWFHRRETRSGGPRIRAAGGQAHFFEAGQRKCFSEGTIEVRGKTHPSDSFRFSKTAIPNLREAVGSSSRSGSQIPSTLSPRE